MQFLNLGETMTQCLLKGGVQKWKVTDIVFASSWDYDLVSAKWWCLKGGG